MGFGWIAGVVVGERRGAGGIDARFELVGGVVRRGGDRAGQIVGFGETVADGVVRVSAVVGIRAAALFASELVRLKGQA